MCVCYNVCICHTQWITTAWFEPCRCPRLTSTLTQYLLLVDLLYLFNLFFFLPSLSPVLFSRPASFPWVSPVSNTPCCLHFVPPYMYFTSFLLALFSSLSLLCYCPPIPSSSSQLADAGAVGVPYTVPSRVLFEQETLWDPGAKLQGKSALIPERISSPPPTAGFADEINYEEFVK